MQKNNLYNDNYGAGNESIYRLQDKRIWKQYSKKDDYITVLVQEEAPAFEATEKQQMLLRTDRL